MLTRWTSWLLYAAVVTAQSPPALPRTPAFEVASVKPNRSGSLGIHIDRPASDRFTATNVPLRVAREDRKFGPEISASKLDCESQPAPPECGMRIGPGQMVMRGTPMSQFAMVLSNFVQRIVLDRTQLLGTFDFRLSWTPDRLPQGAPPPGAPALPPIDPNGPSLFAALQEQLGLKLESTRAPLDVLVIDRVERPTPD